ncbi:uncharacterized protein G2W53_012869 [Senna tora]|uniref:Uncharacterized protein n=1 Tax=Senna tora TaxID=362788 RepID=A0A834U163_9FABA|nr:uncharacterized protein G2W53_012869 [Senna tora]
MENIETHDRGRREQTNPIGISYEVLFSLHTWRPSPHAFTLHIPLGV